MEGTAEQGALKAALKAPSTLVLGIVCVVFVVLIYLLVFRETNCYIC